MVHTGDQPHGFLGALPLGVDLFQHGAAQGLVAHQIGIAHGQRQIALGQHHVDVRQQRAEERPLRVHLAQQGGGGLVAHLFAQPGHGAAKAIPAGQDQPALAPAEAPRDGPQVLDALGGLARGRAGADVEFGNFADGGGLEEIGVEARGFVHQRPVGGHAVVGERLRGLQEGLGHVGRWRQQAGFQRGGHQRFEVAAADVRVAVFGTDHLALFGEADLAAHGAMRLRQNGLVAGATAAAHRAAPAMEHAQAHRPEFAAQLVEQGHQGQLGAVKLPVAGENAAILVAVGIAEHDVLLAAAALDHGGHARQAVEVAHDARRIAQVLDGLEQRHGNQAGHGVGIERAAQQAHFLLQHQHFQQVADRFGVADDGMTNGGSPMAFTHVAGSLEDVQLLQRERLVLGIGHTQRTCFVERPQQYGTTAGFVQRQIVGLDAGHGQQVGHHQFVLVGALPQVHRGQMEAEHLHRPHQRPQPVLGNGFAVLRGECMVDGAQVFQKHTGVRIGRKIHALLRRRLASRQNALRGLQPGTHARQRPPVGFVLPVRAGDVAAVGQRLHGLVDRAAHHRQRQLALQVRHFGQIMLQHHVRLPLQGQRQGLGRHVGIAVTVPADPLPHAQERRHAPALERFFDVGIQAGNFRQERGPVVRERIFYFVGHRQFGKAQQPRVPELCDVRTQPGLVGGQLAQQTVVHAGRFFQRAAGRPGSDSRRRFPRRGGAASRCGARCPGGLRCFGRRFGPCRQRREADGVPLGQQGRDAVLDVQNALALHLGGVRRENRREVCMGQHGRHLVTADAGLVHALPGVREAALVDAAGALVHGAAADVVLVFGQIGQVAEEGEGTDDTDGLLVGQALEQRLEPFAGVLVILVPGRHRQLADFLGQCIGLFALVLANHLAQQPAQQPDVVDQGLVLGLVLRRCFVHTPSSRSATTQPPHPEPSGPREWIRQTAPLRTYTRGHGKST